MIAYEKHETFGSYLWSLDLTPGFATPEPGKCVNLMLAAPERRIPTVVNHSDVVFGFCQDALVFVGKMDALLTPKESQVRLTDPASPETPIALGAVRVRVFGLDHKRLREPQGQTLVEQLLAVHGENRHLPTLGLSHVAWRLPPGDHHTVAWQLLELATTHGSPEEQAYLAAEPVKRWP